MAFMRYADASVARPHVSERGWKKVRKTASAPSRNLVSQASEILAVECVTHALRIGHVADGEFAGRSPVACVDTLGLLCAPDEQTYFVARCSKRPRTM